MGGSSGGIIVVGHSMVQALTDPLVHGSLPTHMQSAVDALAAKGVDNWTQQDCRTALACFVWAATHC